MSTLLIVLTVLTIVFILGIVWSCYNYNLPDAVGIISTTGLILIIIFGWFAAACFDTLYTKEFPAQCQIEKTSRDVIVYPKEHSKKIFEAKYDYDHINDSTEFYYLVRYNHYGGEITRTLKYK